MQSAIRFAGPFGLKLVQWTMKRRIAWTPPSNIIRSGEMDFDQITLYCYHNWALKKSGEMALHTDLHPVREHTHTHTYQDTNVAPRFASRMLIPCIRFPSL